MSDVLCVLLNRNLVARVHQNQGALSLVYADAWTADPQAFPLSLSMPVTTARHTAAVSPFLWGLLPDNPQVLEAWGRAFHVSAGNPFRLLAHVGEDCPGALQLCAEERVRELAQSSPPQIEWMEEGEVAALLARLRADHTAWQDTDGEGRFSLAGAQPKTALFWDREKWGKPAGRTATTHILKPGIPGLNGSVENEYFCLALARRVGLPTAHAEPMRFGAEVAIVIERYDRVLRPDRTVERIHQEDFCQALQVHPARKYQNEGGPTPVQMVNLLRASSSDQSTDVEHFVRALIFNWLIGGTDAHAKNYSLLIGARRHVRLAPLYDVASILPYDHFDARKVKSAMKIGSKYRLHEIDGEEWRKLAKQLRLGEERVIGWARELTERIPEEVSALSAECAERGIEHPILPRLEAAIVQRSRLCGKLLGT